MVVKARKYSWRKAVIFFNKEVGPGTQFDRLPLETLKLIFKHKVIAEQEDKKVKKKSLKEKARLEKEKEKQEALERYEIECEQRRKQHRKRLKQEEDIKLLQKFGSESKFYTAQERVRKLYELREEERRAMIRADAAFVEQIRRRHYRPGVVDPFNFPFNFFQFRY
jgi:alpha-glucosidase (family GH31 glycosyl hydrolase)